MPKPDPAVPPLPVKGADARLKRYKNIAEIHKVMVNARQRAKWAGKPMTMDPGPVLMACVESIAFLAEELLMLGTMVEKDAESKIVEP